MAAHGAFGSPGRSARSCSQVRSALPFELGFEALGLARIFLLQPLDDAVVFRLCELQPALLRRKREPLPAWSCMTASPCASANFLTLVMSVVSAPN
jgi:hypothetical protein